MCFSQPSAVYTLDLYFALFYIHIQHVYSFWIKNSIHSTPCPIFSVMQTTIKSSPKLCQYCIHDVPITWIHTIPLSGQCQQIQAVIEVSHTLISIGFILQCIHPLRFYIASYDASLGRGLKNQVLRPVPMCPQSCPQPLGCM